MSAPGESPCGYGPCGSHQCEFGILNGRKCHCPNAATETDFYGHRYCASHGASWDRRERNPEPHFIMLNYPPKPVTDDATQYQHNYGYETPVWLGDWQWSDTFHRWSRLVRFTDGWEGWTYPKE